MNRLHRINEIAEDVAHADRPSLQMQSAWLRNRIRRFLLKRQQYFNKRWWESQDRAEEIRAAVEANERLPQRPRIFTVTLSDETGHILATKRIQSNARTFDPRNVRIHLKDQRGNVLGLPQRIGRPIKYRQTKEEIARRFGIDPATLSRILASTTEEEMEAEA